MADVVKCFNSRTSNDKALAIIIPSLEICIFKICIYTNTALTEIPRIQTAIIGHSYLRAREAARVTSRRIHHTARTNVRCIHYHSSWYGYTAAIYRAHYYQRGCSCTRYAGISALAQLLSPRLAAAWPPASYLDSSPDKQGLLSPSPCQASTTARARVFALLGNPAPGGFGGLGSVGSVGPHRTLPLCITRQLLSAAAIRHRRLLHGITVKRASLRAFPP